MRILVKRKRPLRICQWRILNDLILFTRILPLHRRVLLLHRCVWQVTSLCLGEVAVYNGSRYNKWELENLSRFQEEDVQLRRQRRPSGGGAAAGGTGASEPPTPEPPIVPVLRKKDDNTPVEQIGSAVERKVGHSSVPDNFLHYRAGPWFWCKQFWLRKRL